MQKIMNWIDARFPLTALWKSQVSEYYAPKNFNFWYFFGSLALVVLVIQIVTGIFLVMHYKPDAAQAFASVEYIMRDVPWGWLVRYIHSTGPPGFLLLVPLPPNPPWSPTAALASILRWGLFGPFSPRCSIPTAPAAVRSLACRPCVPPSASPCPKKTTELTASRVRACPSGCC